MNPKTTAILAIVLLGVVVVAYFAIEGGSDSKTAPGTQKSEAGAKLIDASSDSFDHLTIRSASGQEVQLAKNGGQWRVTAPVDWPADGATVNSILSAVLDLHSRGQIELDPANTASTGLDHPRLIITAFGPLSLPAPFEGYDTVLTRANTIKVEIGNDSALGNDLYVKVGGRTHADQVPASSLKTHLSEGADKLVDSLRDKQLVAVMRAGISKIEVTGHDTRLVVDKQPGGAGIPGGEKWKLTEPVKLSAETSEVDSLLNSVTGLRADRFSTEPAAQEAGARLNDPRLTIWVSTAPPTTAPSTAKPAGGTTIVIGQPVDIEAQKTWVKISSPDRPTVVAQATLDKSAFEQLSKASALTLRDKEVLKIDPKSVGNFTISIARPKPALGPVMPATTRSATAPAAPVTMDVHEFTIEHRQVPATQAAVASTQPTTAPATPSSPPKWAWVFTSGGKGDADEGQVNALLDSFASLKVQKYIDPGTFTGTTYTVTVTDNAGGSSRKYVMTFTDSATHTVGKYDDATFEIGHDLIDKLSGDFKTPKPAPAPSLPPMSLPRGHPPLGGGPPFGE